MVLDLLRKKKSSKEEELERRRNAAILDLAMVQRSKVHIKFDPTTTNITGVSGSVMALNGAGLVLELSGVANLKERFVGQKISCFLKIVEREDRHREIFYNFETTILRIRQHPDKLPQIAVSFPDALHGAQRRKSLRMKPDIQYFSHIAAWKYDASGGFNMAKPTVAHGHFKNNQALLENISAGGLRLLLRRALIKEQSLAPQKGDRFIVFFTFAETAPKLRDEYWLVCKINNIQLDPVAGDVTLGLEFIASGLRQTESGKVAWTKIADNVIDDMAQRIYQWHVTLYRDKGLTPG